MKHLVLNLRLTKRARTLKPFETMVASDGVEPPSAFQGRLPMQINALESALDRSFHGESVNQGVVFSPNLKFSYDLTPKIAANLEYYGSVGPVMGFNTISQQQHQIFPAIDLNIAPQWEINFGLGVGLTGAIDHLIAKMI